MLLSVISVTSDKLLYATAANGCTDNIEIEVLTATNHLQQACRCFEVHSLTQHGQYPSSSLAAACLPCKPS